MKYLGVSIITFTMTLIFFSTSQRVENKISGTKSTRESPDEPYEAFMLQRTYPNNIFDIKAYQKALNSAVSQKQNQRLSYQQSWTLEGPGNIGGRFNCIAVNQLNANVMYAGSANGGVWKTNDNENITASNFC